MPILYMTPLSPPVRAVLLTAKALNIDLELKLVDLWKAQHLTPEFLMLNPQHTVPVLEDDGTIICDSHAIMAYLVRKYANNDQLYPKECALRALVDQRLHFENGVIFFSLRTIVLRLYFSGSKVISEDDRNGLLEGYNYLEIFLNGSKWVAGDSVTIADFSLLPTIASLNYLVKIDEKQFPNILRWIKQAEKLSYYEVQVPGLKEYGEFLKSLIY